MKKFLLAGLMVCGMLVPVALMGCAASESNADPPAAWEETEGVVRSMAEGVSLQAAALANISCDHTFAAVQTVEPSCTEYICIVCDYSYISDYVTSGDTGYIEPPGQDHAHAYTFYVQDAPEEKYFIARYVCDCGASAVGNVSVTATDQNGAVVQLSVNEYGQVDYSRLSGSYTVRITDGAGELLKEFFLTAEGKSPEDKPQEPLEETEQGKEGGSTGTTVLLLFILILLAAGGAAAWLLIRRKKKKNQK